MKRLFALYMVAGWASLLAGVACGETQTASVECLKSATFLAPLDSLEHRKYAPDREIQGLHLALDVTPDFKQRTIRAKAVLRFKPIAKPVQEVKLDAVDLNILSLDASTKVQAWQATEDQVIVTFADPIPPDKETTIELTYSAEPTQGLYFRTPEMGYKAGDAHLFSQGEQIEARHWYPCLDSPNQQLTSEITCRVPGGMTVISNGRLVSESKDPATSLTVFHWSQDKPHANYLISLVAGYLNKLEDRSGDIPLAFFTPPSVFNEATNSFRDTKDMLSFFEQEIGVPYPWGKYDQVCVNDFVAGGMENTSATTLTDRTLFSSATENIRTSEGLISHELAHQWFGDLVTCKDWSHIWLNEGFATYYESLYNAHKNGRDAMLYELYHRTRLIAGMSNDVNAIVRRTYDHPGEMFGYLAYPKASWVLHMLRCQLGEPLYCQCIKTYLERHRFGNVTTEDLRSVIEELSGRSYDQFFDQWVYHAHHPELEITNTWDEISKLAKLSILQRQDLGPNVLLFHLPLTVRFKGKFGTTDRPLVVTKKQEDFYFALDSAPEMVRFDPAYTVLARTRFVVPRPMLYAQLAAKDDVIGRLLAVEQLESQQDQEAIAKLQETLNHDSFFGVRIEAAEALRSIHTEEALSALLASTNQPDARVRQQVVENIGAFYCGQTYAALRQTLAREKNPAIISSAIRALGGYAEPEVRETLLQFLDSQSYRNELADAAVEALRAQDDPADVPPLLERLPRREADFTSRGFAQGLETLAYLARNEEKKNDVREFLLGQVNHKKRVVRLAAINALGTLGDPRAIAVLRTFALASKASPERVAAETALASLRAVRKPVDDFKNLRQEVLDLQKGNRDLRKELEDLKKKVETARSSIPAKRNTVVPKPTAKSPKASD